MQFVEYLGPEPRLAGARVRLFPGNLFEPPSQARGLALEQPLQGDSLSLLQGAQALLSRVNTA